MNLSSAVKLLIAFATVLPIVYMALFFVNFAYLIAPALDGSKLIFEHFDRLMVMHVGVMALMFGLMVFYVVYLFNAPAVKPEMKAVWAVALFMGAPIAMPIFWYIYIWRGDGASSPPNLA